MEKKFEVNWKAYEEQLEKFLTQKSQGDFRDWVQRTNETGDVVWTNTQTMKSQTEHPGHKIFQVNKRILKNKAQSELQNSLQDVNERKFMVMEAMIGLRDKVSKDVSKKRTESAMATARQRAAWRKTKKHNGMHVWVK